MNKDVNKMLLDLRNGDMSAHLEEGCRITEFPYSEIEVSSGNLVFFEPMVLCFYEPFEQKFAPGTYPTYVYTYTCPENGEDHVLVAFHEIRFNTNLPVCYEIALEKSQAKYKFDNEKYAGWSVKTLLAGFIDEVDADDICDYPKDVLSKAVTQMSDAMEKFEAEGTTAIAMKQDFGSIHTTVVSCGRGTNYFGIYIGYDESGEPCSLMMDFECLHPLTYDYEDFTGEEIDDAYDHSIKVKELELPTDPMNGFNHIAIYLRWCYEHELLSDSLLEEYPKLGEVIADETIDFRYVLQTVPIFSGKIGLGLFNSLGRKFTEYYYRFGVNESYHTYPNDVDYYAVRYTKQEIFEDMDLKDEEYLFVPYDEYYYKGLSKAIDAAWREFRNRMN